MLLRHIFKATHNSSGNNITKYIFVTVAFLCFPAHGNITCAGIPEKVYAGAHGAYPSEISFWVVLNGARYRLGDSSDNLAKARYAMALTAFSASQAVNLSFYSLDSCEAAVSGAAVPTAVFLGR